MSRALATVAPGSLPTCTWRAPTARSTHTSGGTRRAFAGCFASSPSPAASPATSRRRRRVDPRGRRARLLAASRLRGGVRQPRPAGLLRRRRWRGRDRAARGELALEQVPRSRPRRRGAADPASQRLQDRQPHGARADPARGAARAAGGLWLCTQVCRGDDPETMHELMAATLDEVTAEIAEIQRRAREDAGPAR